MISVRDCPANSEAGHCVRLGDAVQNDQFAGVGVIYGKLVR